MTPTRWAVEKRDLGVDASLEQDNAAWRENDKRVMDALNAPKPDHQEKLCNTVISMMNAVNM
jgi:hypothetical protein